MCAVNEFGPIIGYLSIVLWFENCGSSSSIRSGSFVCVRASGAPQSTSDFQGIRHTRAHLRPPPPPLSMMVETSGLLMSRNNPLDVLPNASAIASGGAAAAVAVGASGPTRCGMLETRVRGSWYRVTVSLESDYLSVSLDESCEPDDRTTTLNGTLG